MNGKKIELPPDVAALPDYAFGSDAYLKLRRWAQSMAARFNGRVLLVGSCLRKPLPRDIDVRIVISDAEFRARYRVSVGDWHQDMGQWYLDDIAKLTRDVVLREQMNLDLQVQSASHASRYADQPCVLLAESSSAPPRAGSC